MEEGKNKKLYKEPISGYKFKINQKKTPPRKSSLSLRKNIYFKEMIFKMIFQ